MPPSPSKCSSKSFTNDGLVRKKHRAKCEFIAADEVQQAQPQEETFEAIPDPPDNQDSLYNYSCALLREGLLDWARHDAVREGDGPRIVLYWKHDMLAFLARNHPRYAKLAFVLQAQVNSICSPRMAAKIALNRTVNVNGGLGQRMSLDKCMEILNREVKPELDHKGGTLTSATIGRVGKGLKVAKDIDDYMDKTIDFFSGLGRHAQPTYANQLPTLVEELQPQSLFAKVPGRCHASFPKFRHEAFPKLSADKVNTWIADKKVDMSKLQKYNVFG